MRYLKILLNLSLTLGLFLFAGINLSFAASAYTVAQTTATVGTFTNLTLAYTVDTYDEIWADGDTLTLTLPPNLPQWSALVYTVKYDTDTVLDGTGEKTIIAGSNNGQYSINGQTLTIKWDITHWGAVITNKSTINILISGGSVPTYADNLSAFTFGGKTVTGADTDPSCIVTINIAAATTLGGTGFDASAINQVGGAAAVSSTGQLKFNLTFPVALAAGDTIKMTFPANYNISGTSTGTEQIYGLTNNVTVTKAGQVLTLTLTGSGEAAGNNVTISFPSGAVVPSYAATGQNVAVLIEKAAGQDIINSGITDVGLNKPIADTVAPGAGTSTKPAASTPATTGGADTTGRSGATTDKTSTTGAKTTLTKPASATSAGVTGAGTTAGKATGVGSSPFTDVKNHWAKEYITKLYNLKIISGRTATTFAPDSTLTRAEMVKIAVLLFEIKVDENATTNFTDVHKDFWGTKYIAAAQKAGIVSGYSEKSAPGETGKFGPNAPVTRAEAIKILILASKKDYRKVALTQKNPFKDVPQNSWIAPYVKAACAFGIISGEKIVIFEPNTQVTRAEISKIAVKMKDVTTAEK